MSDEALLERNAPITLFMDMYSISPGLYTCHLVYIHVQYITWHVVWFIYMSPGLYTCIDSTVYHTCSVYHSSTDILVTCTLHD